MNASYAKIGSPSIRVVEECGQVLKALGKGEHFGWDSHHPGRPGITNLQQFEAGVSDFMGAVQDLKNSIIEGDGEKPQDLMLVPVRLVTLCQDIQHQLCTDADLEEKVSAPHKYKTIQSELARLLEQIPN